MTDEPEEWKWKPLLPDVKLERPMVLKKAQETQRYLSELKEMARTLNFPEERIVQKSLPNYLFSAIIIVYTLALFQSID